MPKDLKIGLALGVVLVIAVVFWLATRPKLSTAMLSYRQPPSSESLQPPGNEDSPYSDLPAKEENLSISPPTLADANLLDSTVYEQAEKIQTEKFHIVRRGETLSQISERYYGSAAKWRKILAANRNSIRDANKVKAGTKLIIPD